MTLLRHLISDFNIHTAGSVPTYWWNKLAYINTNFYTKRYKSNLGLGEWAETNLLTPLSLYTVDSNDNVQNLLPNIYKIHSSYAYFHVNLTSPLRIGTVNNLISVRGLRIEFLYTKLKYSRSPAYDIVSGGAAAIFAGLLGFLVSEKFGIELVDSGDFYYLFMYLVFLSFSINPILTFWDEDDTLWSIFGLWNILEIYVTLVALIINFFKK